ncbi:MAG TPA: hypothetical protein VGL59_03910 [Polyangia bacterium]
MPKLCLFAFCSVALGACSTSSPVGPTGNVDAGGGNNTDSSSGSGGAPGSGGVVVDAGSGSGGMILVKDAGPGGSDGSADAPLGGDGGPSSGGPCAGVFCEDFEQGQLDPAIWDVQTGSGGVETIEQDTVAHGKYALHMHGTGAGGDFALIVSKNMPKALQGAGPIFGRAYLYATAVSGAHVELGFAGTTHDPAVAASVTTKGMNFNYMEFADFSGSWQIGFDLFAPDPSIAKGFVEEASYPPARDKAPVMKWNCIEWEFGDDPEMMVLWVDGKQIDQFDLQHIDFTSVARTPGSVLNGKSSGIIGGYNVFGFGIHSYGASPGGVDRYYDDIVLDTKRVSCLP